VTEKNRIWLLKRHIMKPSHLSNTQSKITQFSVNYS